MASPDIDPLANTDEIHQNLSKINPNLAMLTENDINLIQKMQYLSSLAPQPIQPKTNGRNTSLVTNKSLPDILCTCPQKCDEKIPLKVRTYMFKYYHALSRDRPKQEALLLRFIEMKSLAQRLKEDNKRVQCRYKAPTNRKAIQFIFEDESVSLSDDEGNENEPKQKRAKLDLDKEESPNPNPNEMTVLKSDPSITYRIDKSGNTEVCQKAFMNVFLVPEKRVRAVREKLVASKRIIIEKEMAQAQVMNSELETAVKIAQDLAAGCKPLLQMLQQNHPNKISDEDDSFDISGQLLNAIDSDIELVNNFFYNQLWKPEIFEGFVSPKDVAPTKNLLNGTYNGTFDSSLNSTAKSVNGTMNSALLDETFDSVINASAQDSDVNMTAPEESIQESTINESTINEETFQTDNDPLEEDTQEDPFEKDPLESPASAEDLEVQAASENTPLPNGDMPLNLNINGGATSPDSISSRTSPDSTVSRNSSSTTTSNSAGLAKPLNLATENGAAMDLSTSSPHRSSSSSSSSKSRSSHHNGSHRSEPMRNSSRSSSSTSSIQNILNNHQAAVAAAAAAGNFFMPPLMPSALFDPDLTKYLSGLESSISITPKMSNGRERGSGSRRSRNNGNGNYANGANSQATAAALTAQLIQNALAQSSISVTATTGGSSSRYNQHSMSSLNQILNIPDSVSITPTLVDKSKS
uniref:Uncharacterized protein n=2 Tax=Cacopsylla melanoneura TaxID=428564 RepID=A0A8D8TLJ5_9HEMI